jgi:SSS family solute:Na+ symporter
MIIGSTLASSGILLQQTWKWLQPQLLGLLDSGPMFDYLAMHAQKFPINSQWMNLIAVVSAIVVYVVISLFTCREDFNMDRMLHRGIYAKDPVGAADGGAPPTGFRWGKLIGIDENFTRSDKAISISVFSWKIFWFVAGFAMLAWNLLNRWPLKWWSWYWFVSSVIIPLLLAAVTTIWFTWGGVRDLRRLFASLKTVNRNALDDGTVVNHHNLDDSDQK